MAISMSQARARRVSSLTLMEAELLEFWSRMKNRQWGSMDSTASSLRHSSLDNVPGVSLYGKYIQYRECEGPDVEVQAEAPGITVLPTARSSITSMNFDASPRNSDDSQDRRFEAMARNSLSSLQQRRQSNASAFIKEPLVANTDDRNWSWSYLRERFRIKDLEDLFDQYQLRIHHAMLINYLMIQLCLSTTFIISLLSGKHVMEELVPEMTGHVAGLAVCMSLLVYVYNEHTFRLYPRLHIIMSSLVILTLFTTDVAITLFFKDNSFPNSQHYNIKSGNMMYLLLVVYVFLPISHKWQTVVLAGLLTAGDLGLSYYAISRGHLETEHQHIVTKMCVDTAILICVNLLGIYWRFMSEVAFRRAFLDKRGSLESKFKVEAEKKQEESLLLSILPKNLMQQVKADFRNMIERTIFNTNPVTKSNPFPNLYINHHEMVSILYADIVNFTVLTTKLSPDQLVMMLNDLFGKFDDAAETNGCLRIKLLGDCYYCVSGVPEFNEDHANNCVKVGLEMIDIIREVREMRNVNVDMRIGIHSGSVLSGLIGVRKWQFDVWSNAATIANHMEQTGSAGRIHVTQKTQELINDLDYQFEMSNAREKDPLLQEEDIETFFLIPNQRRTKMRRVHHMSTANIKTPMSIASDSKLDNFYEGDMPKRVAKVQLPQGVSKPSILNRRRSTFSETPSSSKRRTVVTDTALTNFQTIMVNSRETMEREIENMPLRKTDQWFHPEGIHPFFLNFTNYEWELPLLRQPDPLYKYYIVCAVVVFISIFVTQQSLMPGNSLGWQAGVGCLVLLSVVTMLVWFATIHQHIVDPHNDLEEGAKNRFVLTKFFYWSSTSIITSIGVRVLLYLVVCIALYTCAVINVIECEDILNQAITILNDVTTSIPVPFANNGSNGPLNPNNYPPALCCDPWYFTYSTALTLLVAWTFFRMHFFLKFLVYLLAVSIHGFFIFDFAEVMFNHAQLTEVCPSLVVTSLGLSPGMGHLLFLIMIFLALHVLDRQMEYITRLDFQWKQQLEKEQKEAETTHYANKLLLQNILPLHVAEMYLNRQNATDELYHESFKNVSVIFASIPNYSKLYRDNMFDEDGTKCLRVLNEIISDFDMLTYEDSYQTIEKIKVVGSTYMAACGLLPAGDELSEEESSMKENVSTIAKFAASMFEKLEIFNAEGFMELQLRVGINAGPVIAGVVGAHKPMYDIWGDTVNVASRMDYTGDMGKIHVTAMVGDILQGLGWNVTSRGEIKVKGKGLMKTYFVDPMSAPRDPPLLQSTDNPSNNNNNINKRRKSSQDTMGERRRSSQLSLMSIKGFLTSHRGSLDINTNKDVDTQSTRSLPIYKPIKNENETPHRWEMEEFGSTGTTPRSSYDSKDSGVVKGSYRASYPSPVAEEAEWAAGATSPLQKDPSKSSVPTTQAALGQDPLRRFNNNEILKQLVSGKAKQYLYLQKNSTSSPDLSRMQVTGSTDVRNSSTIGASRKTSKSSKSKKCPDVRQTQDHLLSRSHTSTPHTSITMESDEAQSVWL